MYSTHKLVNQCLKSKRVFSSFSPEMLLRQENQQNCMRKFQAMSVKQESTQVTRTAAVLIPVCVHGDEVSLLYTKRAQDLKSHSGQVSFPGGMEDDTDKSIEETALRETYEEIGLDSREITIWGTGNQLIRQNLRIIPVIGKVTTDFPLESLKINTAEVDQVFTINLEHLCSRDNCTQTQFRGSFSTPIYLGAAYKIWGLTGVLTFMFLKALVPRQLYSHQIKYIPDVVQLIKKKPVL